MSNHSHLQVPQRITPEMLNNALNQINAKRFGRVLEVLGPVPVNGNGTEEWIVRVPGMGPFWSFPIWLRFPKKIEFRHPDGHPWLLWAQCRVFAEELAVLFAGRIFEDGVALAWKGHPEDFPTFSSWITSMLQHAKNGAERIEQALNTVPTIVKGGP